MWIPLSLAAGALLIAGTMVKRWLRRPARGLDVGLVSTNWLADQKMGKHDPGWP
jgi:hypothetical protein